MGMIYDLENGDGGSKFSIEIVSGFELLKNDEMFLDFWKLFQELTTDEVAYHSAVGLTVNGNYTIESIKQVAGKWDKIFFIKDASGKRIGCCQTRFDSKYGSMRLGCLIVTKSYRGRHLGSTLLQNVINSYDKDISLVVSAGNQCGIKLYQKFGFGITDYKMIRKTDKK